jgi:hypothetical protein
MRVFYMKQISKRLKNANRVDTPTSEVTSYINYSYERKILEVGIKSGRTYQYKHFPIEVWERYNQVIEAGESSGKFYNKEIKPNYPDFEEID